jgi:cytochrome c-type biogenesis protein CcmH/NrfF
VTRARLDGALRAWAIMALVFWVMAAGAILGTGSSSAASVDATAATSERPALEQRRDTPQTSVAEVSRGVMCPTCEGTLAQSDSPAADRMREWIDAAVAAGWTRQEIRDGLVAEYGGDESILAVPRAGGVGVGAWLAPLLIVLGVVVAGVLVPRRWRRERVQTRSGSSSSSQASASSTGP